MYLNSSKTRSNEAFQSDDMDVKLNMSHKCYQFRKESFPTKNISNQELADFIYTLILVNFL